MTMTAGNLAGPYDGPLRTGQPAAPGRYGSLLTLLPIVLLVYSALLPPEVRLTLAGQNLYAPRIVGFLLLPFLLLQMVRGNVPFKLVDGLALLGSFWMVFSFVLYYGFAQGILRGTALGLDVIIPYFIARQCIRNLTDLRRLLVLIAPGVVAIGGIMMLEAISGRLIIRSLGAAVFGPLQGYVEGEAVGASVAVGDSRFGLLRAYGPFSHPILGGIFMASMLPLFWSSGLRGWPFLLGVSAGVFAFSSGSSAALLFLILATGLLVYDRVQEKSDLLNWPLLIFGATLLFALLEVIAENGAIASLARFTLTPYTAQYRLLIWEFGTQSVANHPLIGIGFTGYERPAWMGESIDNHWLMLAIRHGIIVPFCFLLLCLVITIQLGRRSVLMDWRDRITMVGLGICLVLMVLLGFTVAYFGSALTWFFLIVGIVASLSARPSR